MDPTTRRRRTMLIAAIAGGLILVLLVGVGVYGLIRGPQPTAPDDTAPSDQPTVTAPVVEPAAPEPVIALGGAEEFAAARQLAGWKSFVRQHWGEVAIAARGPIAAVTAPSAKPATFHTGCSAVGRTPRRAIIASKNWRWRAS